MAGEWKRGKHSFGFPAASATFAEQKALLSALDGEEWLQCDELPACNDCHPLDLGRAKWRVAKGGSRVVHARTAPVERCSTPPFVSTPPPFSLSPKDCGFSEWGDWTPLGGCSGLCSRERGIMVKNNECGKPCLGATQETAQRDGCLESSRA